VKRKGLLAFLFLVVLLGLVALFSLCVGTVWISPLGLFSLLGRREADSTIATIVWELRLPRVLLGFGVGGALSLAGVMLQGLFRNPLVEPYTLGISGGAALCVAVVISLGLRAGGLVTLPVAGFCGGLAVILLLYLLSARRGILNIQGLLLTGVMLSFISSSLIMLVMALSRTDDLHGILFWIMGFLGDANWGTALFMLVVSLGGFFISYPLSLRLNALALGEEEAAHLGVNIEATKRGVFLLASLLTGLCVASSGVIGFVGLVVPHLMRLLFGPDHRFLMPGSFLFGAVFLVLCDTIARTIVSPTELPVGVITGIVGGVLFIHALSRKRMGL